MGTFVLRRLLQAVFTVFGVMLLTFVLFRVVAGDVSAMFVPRKANYQEQREKWLQKHGLDKPALVNRKAPYQFWKGEFWDTQFFWHLRSSALFEGRSYATEEKLQDIIAKRAPYSLALTVPAMALGWMLGLVLAAVVAYYRDTWIDRTGVFLSVLGMCVPYLAYMILGQWIMFEFSPRMAWGLGRPTNIYVPILIAVIAGLGGEVRFYRTVILDEIHRDYVRTAQAKGLPLPEVLFKHVLKNCMLPILTQLVLEIPFLIMGALLLEQFFGIPGLGDLMLSSIATRDVPIINGLTFLTAVVYVVGLLITDVLYAVFDPRIRLK